MPLPAGYLPRRGDVLIMHCAVKYDVENKYDHVHLLIDRRYKHTSQTVPLDQVAGLYCRAWEVDSLVTRKGGPKGVGIVLATYEDQVWVMFHAANPISIHANALEPAPEIAAAEGPTEQPAPAPNQTNGVSE